MFLILGISARPRRRPLTGIRNTSIHYMLKKYPFYIQATVILFGLILFSYAIFNLREILVPLSFAAFLAVLLNPLVNLFLRWKMPRLLAIVLALLAAIV